MNQNMHRQELLDLYAERPNYGKILHPTHEIKAKNPSCSDEILLQLDIKNNIITDAKFSGETCLISTVSAGVLLEKVKGMKIEDALKIKKEEVDELLGVEIIATRVKCELLALEALKKIFDKQNA